jgi:hypothetical protein
MSHGLHPPRVDAGEKVRMGDKMCVERSLIDDLASRDINKVYRQRFNNGDVIYFRPERQLKNGNFRGKLICYYAGSPPIKPVTYNADPSIPSWELTLAADYPKVWKDNCEPLFPESTHQLCQPVKLHGSTRLIKIIREIDASMSKSPIWLDWLVHIGDSALCRLLETRLRRMARKAVNAIQ